VGGGGWSQWLLCHSQLELRLSWGCDNTKQISLGRTQQRKYWGESKMSKGNTGGNLRCQKEILGTLKDIKWNAGEISTVNTRIDKRHEAKYLRELYKTKGKLKMGKLWGKF
jgi:hypothetical protein